MAFEPHPWFIGLEGVEHSAEVARNLAWSATSGASGIIEPSDLRVRAQSVPSDSVRIAPGGFVVASKYAGASQQSYIERAPTETSLEIPATGSSGGATRYVVARVTDPDYPGGGTIPSVPNDGVYAAPYVVSSLSSSRTEIPLAKIKQPANTSAITNAMITDLREVANPRKDYGVFARPRIMEDEGTQIKLTSRYVNGSDTFWGSLFPGGSNVPNEATLFIPDWATYMVISAKWMGIVAHSGENAWGRYWIEYGDEYREHSWSNGRQYEFSTQQFGFNTTGTTGNYRTEWSLDDARAIPSKLRGKDVKFAFKAGLDANASTSGITMDYLGGLSIRVDYVQRREDADTI